MSLITPLPVDITLLVAVKTSIIISFLLFPIDGADVVPLPT
jgi:hypothetical protein